MDIRTMQYYLAVVREGTISAAAEVLHVAQPSLSRQMKELEEELGASLFVRGNRKITLTEEGMILRRRAEEMIRLMQMTEEEIAQIKEHISGTVRIGAGESLSFHHLSRAASELAKEHPDIRFQLTSGDTQDGVGILCLEEDQVFCRLLCGILSYRVVDTVFPCGCFKATEIRL